MRQWDPPTAVDEHASGLEGRGLVASRGLTAADRSEGVLELYL